MHTTTTFELPAFRMTKSLGVVRGITVRTRSLPLSILGSLRTLFGGRAGIFSDLCESAREESFQLMLAHARKLGANAVIGVRYDTGPMVGAAEVLCYGTAVVVEPMSAQ
ncbi:MAG: YbjQ family protein [Gammaproteobacteria bacterium]